MLTLRDWLDIIGGTLLVGSPIIYTVFGKRFYEKWLDHRFLAEHERMKLALNKDLEAYKQSLLDEAEHIKANHRRALQHFSPYVTKKHEVYPELYKLLTLAHGKVMHLEEGNAVPVEIRRSLLVADFTGHRGGVYFEAGFALGLGIPVIWTCREDDIKNAHFDTRQYNHIGWQTPLDLRDKLVNRIRATAPLMPGTA